MDQLGKNDGHNQLSETLVGEKAEKQQLSQDHGSETTEAGLNHEKISDGHNEPSLHEQDVILASQRGSICNPPDAKNEKASSKDDEDVHKKNEDHEQSMATPKKHEAVQQGQDEQSHGSLEDTGKDGEKAICKDPLPPTRESNNDECTNGQPHDAISSHAASAPDSGKAAEKHVNASNASQTASLSRPTAESSSETPNNADNGAAQKKHEEKSAAVTPDAKGTESASSTREHAPNIAPEPTPVETLTSKSSTSGSTSSEIRSKKKKALSARLSPSIANKDERSDMDHHPASARFPVRRQKARPALKSITQYNDLFQADKPTGTGSSAAAKEDKPRPRVHYDPIPESPENTEQPTDIQLAKEPSVKDEPDSTFTPPVENVEKNSHIHQGSIKVALPTPPEPITEDQHQEKANIEEADAHCESKSGSDRRSSSRHKPPSVAESDVRSRKSESRDDTSRHGRRKTMDKPKKQGLVVDIHSLGKMGDARRVKHVKTNAQLRPKKSTHMIRRTSSGKLKQDPTRHRDLDRKVSRRTLLEVHERSGVLKQHRSRSTFDSHQQSLPGRHHRESHNRRRSPASARSGSIRTSLISLLLRSASILRHFAHRHAEPRLSRSGNALRSQRLRQSEKDDFAAEVHPPRRARDRGGHRLPSDDAAQSRNLRAHRDRHPPQRRRNRELSDDWKGVRLRRDLPDLLRRQTDPYAPDDSQLDSFRPYEDVGSRERRQRSQHVRSGMEPLEAPRMHRRRWSE